MKMNKLTRILCMLLAMLMLVCVVSCKKDDNPPEETTPKKTVTVNAPSGYAVYKNDDIGFAYPEDWTRADSSVMMIIDAVTGSNITLECSEETSVYEEMTESDANEMLTSIMSAIGATVSNVTLKKETNANGLLITKISCNTRAANGETMFQTMLSTNAGGQTYVVTVTEKGLNPSVWQTVFDTLVKAA